MPKKDTQVIDETIDFSNDDEYLKDEKLETLIDKKALTEKDMTSYLN